MLELIQRSTSLPHGAEGYALICSNPCIPVTRCQYVQDAVESKQFINQVFNFIDKRGAWKTRPEACIVAAKRMQQVTLPALQGGLRHY